MTSASIVMTKPLTTIVKIVPREIAARENLPVPEAKAEIKQPSRELSANQPKSPPISIDAASPETQSTTLRDFILPRIDVGVLVRSAGAIAREAAAAYPRSVELNHTISPMTTAIAGAARNEVWVESRTSEGFVMKNGKTTCIIAPQFVPHYMQGMLIVPQCTTLK